MIDRRHVLNVFAALFAVGAAPEAKPSETAGWPEAVLPLSGAKATESSFGTTSVYFEGKTDQLKTMTAGSLLLKPGQEPHPPHQHPEEEFVLITEGNGEIVVGGKTIAVGPGALMYSESNKLHGIKNTGTVPLRFYFFKWAA